MITGDIHLAAPRRRHGSRDPPPPVLRRSPERMHGDDDVRSRRNAGGAMDRKHDTALHGQRTKTQRRTLPECQIGTDKDEKGVGDICRDERACATRRGRTYV